MGYYIYVDLYVKSDKEFEIIDDFRNTNENAMLALDEGGGRNNDISWYSFDKDLAEFSKKYPKALFTAYIEGSGVNDFSVQYMKVIQVTNSDGEHIALYGTERTDDNVNSDIEKCYKMGIEMGELDPDIDPDDAAETYLDERGIFRIFADEVFVPNI